MPLYKDELVLPLFSLHPLPSLSAKAQQKGLWQSGAHVLGVELHSPKRGEARHSNPLTMIDTWSVVFCYRSMKETTTLCFPVKLWKANRCSSARLGHLVAERRSLLVSGKPGQVTRDSLLGH